MGQEKLDTSPAALLWPLRPERLLVVVLLVITVGFGVGYARLFYEHRQALVERRQAEKRLQYEETRSRDLRLMEGLSTQEWFQQAEAARLFGRPSQATEAVAPEAAEPAPASDTAQEREVGEKIPVWQQWLERFHIFPAVGNRAPG